MMNKNEKVKIAKVENKEEKRLSYQSNLIRYKRAIKAECYVEALMIDYACLDDRLRYMLHYLGILTNPEDNRIRGRYTVDSIRAIMDTYIPTGNRRIRDISGKRNIVKGVFKMLADPEKQASSNIYEKVLREALHGDERIHEVLKLMDTIENWCLYRNEIVHDLMGKRIDNLDQNLKEQALHGYDLFRKLDNMVGWIKRKQIPKKIGIEVTKIKKKKR